MGGGHDPGADSGENSRSEAVLPRQEQPRDVGRRPELGAEPGVLEPLGAGHHAVRLAKVLAKVVVVGEGGGELDQVDVMLDLRVHLLRDVDQTLPQCGLDALVPLIGVERDNELIKKMPLLIQAGAKKSYPCFNFPP